MSTDEKQSTDPRRRLYERFGKERVVGLEAAALKRADDYLRMSGEPAPLSLLQELATGCLYRELLILAEAVGAKAELDSVFDNTFDGHQAVMCNRALSEDYDTLHRLPPMSVRFLPKGT